MGECVVACVGTSDGDACDGDRFIGADVFVCKCGGGTGGGEGDIVKALFSCQGCGSFDKECCGAGGAVVDAVVGGDAGNGEFFGGDGGCGAWLGECVVACIGATDGDACNGDCLSCANSFVCKCGSGGAVIQCDEVT